MQTNPSSLYLQSSHTFKADFKSGQQTTCIEFGLKVVGFKSERKQHFTESALKVGSKSGRL